MGFLGLKSTLIPMDIVRVNESERTIEVSDSKDHVKDAPSFDDDEDITTDYENRIRSHFGLQSLGTSERGYGAYSSTGDEHADREGEGARPYETQDDSTDDDDRPSADSRYRGSGESYEGGSSIGSTEAPADETAREAPTTRHTEETQTFQEGGRTKSRRRVIREEIIEEDDPKNRNNS
jgi:hypothetical protein